MPKYFHVITKGVHPNNLWTRRPDGLYELAGSAYAFPEERVVECTAQGRRHDCACLVSNPMGEAPRGRSQEGRPLIRG